MKKSDKLFLDDLEFELGLKKIDVVFDIDENDKKKRDKAYFKKIVDNEEQNFSCEVDSLFRMKTMYEEQMQDPRQEISSVINDNLNKKLDSINVHLRDLNGSVAKNTEQSISQKTINKIVGAGLTIIASGVISLIVVMLF